MSRESWKKLEGKIHIVEVELVVADNEVIILQQKQWENLIIRKILLQFEK